MVAVTRSFTAMHWGNYDVVTSGGRVVAMDPAPEDPHPSLIGPGMPSALYDRARIMRPAVRQGWLERGPGQENSRGAEPFVEVSWERAVALVAEELERVRHLHGNESIYGGSYGWASAGRFHHAQSQIHRFLACYGGYTAHVNSYSAAALQVILPHVIGGQPLSILNRMPVWHEIAEHGELVVAFGGLALKNTQVNAGGIGVHRVRDWQIQCREAGVEFVSISPLRDDVASFLDAEWIAPRPNTDTAVMLGIAHTLVAEDLHDRDFLERCCVGFDRFEAYLLGDVDGVAKDAAWAADIAELEPTTIRRLARRIAARRTVVAVSWSVQRADHGEQPYWMGVTLAAMSGSMGKPGGGFGAGHGATAMSGGELDRWPIASLPTGRNEVEAFIPVARIADMLLNPGAPFDYNGRRFRYPDCRLIYWCGGNPFHHHQDLNRLARAWQRPETVIVHDSWWNASARFADIVLPAATALERDDFAVGASDRWLSIMHKAADPPGEARTDYEIFCLLADCLGIGEAFSEGRDADEWVRYLYELTRAELRFVEVRLPVYEEMCRIGRIELPPSETAVNGDFKELRSDPSMNSLDTPSGRIEIFSETIAAFGYADCCGHPSWFEPAEWLGGPLAERFPLHLISNQPHTRLHSQYDNGTLSRASKIADREPILLHPDDASARGISNGDVVRVFNDRGGCLAGAVVSDAIRRGVVQIATGAWYDPEEPGAPWTLDRHGNPNTLTRDQGTSALAQGPTALTTLVAVERLADELPPVRVFDPPSFVDERRAYDGTPLPSG